MSTKIYGEDVFSLDAEKITTGTDPDFGPMTIFHDCVIASEMVQPYGDGMALKHRDELEAYACTVNGRWVILGGHPEDAIISSRDQISGRTANAHFVKNLKDPKTDRPNRSGVKADIQIFDKRANPKTLEDMKKGKKVDVSIGFFYRKDSKAGEVGDGPFKGEKYDYVQRDMFHDHLAAGIDRGRCPSPYCGLTADEMNQKVAGDPFSGFANFAECKAEIMSKNPKMKESMAEGICGKLKAEYEKKQKKDAVMKKAVETLNALTDEIEALKGEKDALKESTEWWKSVDWKAEANRSMFDALSDETRKLITDSGLCPTCLDEAARKISTDATLEQINKRITELQSIRKEKLDKIRSLEDTLFKQESPDEKARREATQKDISALWATLQDIDTELHVYLEAKTMKLVQTTADGKQKEGSTEPIDDYDEFMLPHLEKDAVLTSAQRGKLPDDAFAYIDPDCKKKDGKTPDSCRHLPIENATHTRAALAALEGARSGKVPPYADKAKPKVCAAAKKFGIESTICGEKKKDEAEPKKALDPYVVLRKADELLKK